MGLSDFTLADRQATNAVRDAALRGCLTEFIRAVPNALERAEIIEGYVARIHDALSDVEGHRVFITLEYLASRLAMEAKQLERTGGAT